MLRIISIKNPPDQVGGNLKPVQGNPLTFILPYFEGKVNRFAQDELILLFRKNIIKGGREKHTNDDELMESTIYNA